MTHHAMTRTDALVAFLARMLIAWRRPLGALFLLLTLGLGYSALNTRLDPGFNKLIPMSHPYMQAFLQYGSTFSGANRVMVSVRWKGEGDIYNPTFMKALQQVTDEVFFIPGVNRGEVRSLFTPNVRFIEVTEEGFNGDVVIPAQFNADPESLALVRGNVAKSGQIGRLVANDLKSALVQADLLEINPQSGEKLDYASVAEKLEAIRAAHANEQIDIHIVGFAKVMGDVMEGLTTVLLFFVIAFGITTTLLWIAGTTLTIVSLVRRSRAWPYALGTLVLCAGACLLGIAGYIAAVGA